MRRVVSQTFDVDTDNLYPLLDTSPVSAGDLSLISPATTQELTSPDSEGEAESFHSAGVSPASLSITHCGAAAPVATAGSSSVVDPGRNRSCPAASTHQWLQWLPQPTPDPVPVLPPSLFREGPFDAATCSAATTEHPLITNQPLHLVSGLRTLACGYPIWSAGLPSTIPGVGGAPESARLLGRPPADWLRVMSREQTLHAALQLQRDASLMSSNMNVMQQYAISLHRTTSDILQLVFG